MALGQKKKVFVSDNPTESKNFRRLNEIFFKFSKKKFYLGNFRRIDASGEIQNGGGSERHIASTIYHDLFLGKSTYLREKKWILSIERRKIVFYLILVEKEVVCW